MGLEFIYQGQGSGAVADRLLDSNFDPNALRAYRGKKDGRSYVPQLVTNADGSAKLDSAGKPLYRGVLSNAPATLRRDEWKLFDDAVVTTARAETRIWDDLQNAGLGRNIPNGMSKTVIQGQSIVPSGNAQLSMDGISEAKRDRPVHDLMNLPLPIAHADFSFTARELAVSRNGGDGLDVTQAEEATRQVMQLIEGLTVGTLASYTYGGGTIYGLTNHPDRTTFTPTLPTTPGWTPNVLVNEILSAIQDMSTIFFRGRFGVYFSPDWDEYLDNDYSAAYSGDTLRTRLGKIANLSFIRRLDYLPAFSILLVDMNRRTIQAITGMRLTTLQWESHGGMQFNFKVMGILVPWIRANANGDTGIAHGVAA
jgi:hypothetical protein